MDELELWEIAAVLGKNVSPEEAEEADGLTFNQRRAQQLEEERPEWMDDEPLSPGEEAMLAAIAKANRGEG